MNEWQTEGNPVAGTRVESWTHTREEGGSAWLQVIGLVSYLDGEPFFKVGDTAHMEFHADPPTPTDGYRLWRYLT